MTLQLSFEGIHVGLEQGVDGLAFAFDGGELRIDCSNYSGQILLSPLPPSARLVDDVDALSVASTASADVQPRQPTQTQTQSQTQTQTQTQHSFAGIVSDADKDSETRAWSERTRRAVAASAATNAHELSSKSSKRRMTPTAAPARPQFSNLD